MNRSKGKITKVINEKRFFFIENDYWCHFNNVDFVPEKGMEVEFEKSKGKNGKDAAINVKLIGKTIVTNNSQNDFWSRYKSVLQEGYFNEKDFIKQEFVLQYSIELAKQFSKDAGKNKPTQIRKYFDYCTKIEGILKINKEFNYVKAEIPKLISHINNAMNKKLVSKEFYDFISWNVEQAIKSETNFTKGFMPHFESILGFINNN